MIGHVVYAVLFLSKKVYIDLNFYIYYILILSGIPL